VNGLGAILMLLGYHAEEMRRTGADGEVRSYVITKLGPGSETTNEWAVIDPRTGQVYTSPDGRMAHPSELEAHPDWVAADGDPWTFWTSGPRAINFQIGDICNMHCIMCWQDLRRADTPRQEWRPEMTAATLRSVLERYLLDLVSMELVSFGEPMANPQFDEMVHVVGELGHRRRRKIELNVITNGSLLHIRRHRQLLHQPGYLTFSIDAADEEGYERIRDGGSWQDVVRNLRDAVRHPQRHTDRKIGINMTVFKANLHEVFAMGAFAAGLGVDYLSILHGAVLERSRAADQQLEPGHPDLVRQIERIRRSFPWLTLNDYATGRTLPALPVNTQPGRGFCPLPWRQIDVGPDGRAHPCCRSYGIDLGPFDRAWTGEPLRELRRQILAGRVDPVRFEACASCSNLGNADRAASRTAAASAGSAATVSRSHGATRVIPLRVS